MALDRTRAYKPKPPEYWACTVKECNYCTDRVNPLSCSQHPRAPLTNGSVQRRGAARTAQTWRESERMQRYAGKVQARAVRRRRRKGL